MWNRLLTGAKLVELIKMNRNRYFHLFYKSRFNTTKNAVSKLK